MSGYEITTDGLLALAKVLRINVVGVPGQCVRREDDKLWCETHRRTFLYDAARCRWFR